MKNLVSPYVQSFKRWTSLVLMVGIVIAPTVVAAQSASPTPIITVPGPQQCTTISLPNVSTCRTETAPGVYNCIDFSRDYCTSMWENGFQAWAIGLQPDGQSCDAAGMALYNMLLKEGCVNLGADGMSAVIDGSCAVSKTGGHALVVVKAFDERKKGSYAEFLVIEPQGQYPVASWRTTQDPSRDPGIQSGVIVKLRDLYFPLLSKYNVPILIRVANACDLPRKVPVSISIAGKTIKLK